MITLKDIRYVRLGTNDMDSAVKFATRILGLELDVQDGQAAYLRSDQRDHTLVYLNAPVDDHTVGFELESLEKPLAELSSRFLSATKGKFGPNSGEYRQVGGTPSANRLRSSKKAAKPPAARARR